MKSNLSRAVLVLACSGAVRVGSAQASLITFNTTTDLANNFQLNDFNGTAGAQPGGNQPTNIGTGGLGGSGSVLPANDATSLQSGTEVFNTGLPFSAGGRQIVLSMYLQEQSSVATAHYHALKLGIMNSTSGFLRDGGAGPYAAIYLDSVVNDTFTLGRVVGPSGSLVNVGSTFNLVPGNWYKLEGIFSNLGGGNVSLAAELFNSDANGNLGSVVASFNPITVANTMASASTAFGGFRGYSLAGASHYDNFDYTLVPEPSTIFLLGVGALWIGRTIKRRKAQA